jgi:hypothetical protein
MDHIFGSVKPAKRPQGSFPQGRGRLNHEVEIPWGSGLEIKHLSGKIPNPADGS